MQIEFNIHWGWVLLYLIIYGASIVLRLRIFLLDRKMAKEKKKETSSWSRSNFEQSIGRTDRRDVKTEAEFPFDEEDPE